MPTQNTEQEFSEKLAFVGLQGFIYYKPSPGETITMEAGDAAAKAASAILRKHGLSLATVEYGPSPFGDYVYTFSRNLAAGPRRHHSLTSYTQ